VFHILGNAGNKESRQESNSLEDKTGVTSPISLAPQSGI